MGRVGTYGAQFLIFLVFFFLGGGWRGACSFLRFYKENKAKECGKQYKNNINVVNLNNANHTIWDGKGFVELPILN